MPKRTAPLTHTPSQQPRARSFGIPLRGTPGRWNAITDVPGLEVGMTTLIEGEGVRTGVTAIHPRGRGAPGDPCAAGFHCFNGNGEMTGVSWIRESGTMSGPVAQATEEAILDALVANEEMVGYRGHRSPALPRDRVVALLRERGNLV